MIELPAIQNNIMNRPGNNAPLNHFITDSFKQEFWDNFYYEFHNSFQLQSPISDFDKKINPYFGYFGYRWHPINFIPRYFHTGIDIGETIGTHIKPIHDGFLEYSGFANVNGNYIIVKHPEIRTKDGFIFYSLYMHCDNLSFKFSVLQKILREYISGNLKIANMLINKNQNIATVGSTGNKFGVVPHLHLQCEFIKDNQHIAIDPLKLFKKDPVQNLTANFASQSEFKNFYMENIDNLQPWEKFWSTKIQ